MDNLAKGRKYGEIMVENRNRTSYNEYYSGYNLKPVRVY